METKSELKGEFVINHDCSKSVSVVFRAWAVNKDGRHDVEPKVKPKHLDCPLVADCSIRHKACLLIVSRWDTKSKKTHTSKDDL